jgi:drug/metabolite transporter (DMT)-like permease
MAFGPGKSDGYLVPLAIKTISLIAIYSTYGLLQERIIKGHYKSGNGGDSADTFASPPLLVLCNRLVSLVAGLALLRFQPSTAYLPITSSTSPLPQTWEQRLSAQLARLKPASPLFYYALVAALNNAATLSQYASLSQLSFTTSTLGKSAKMVPVLIIGHVWYGKKYKPRQWVGAVIVIVGIWGYLSSLPTSDIGKDGKKRDHATNWIGVMYLFTYLLFDGLTSTMQERLFGHEKAAEEPSTLAGITGGIIDQMVSFELNYVDPIPLTIYITRFGSMLSHQ